MSSTTATAGNGGTAENPQALKGWWAKFKKDKRKPVPAGKPQHHESPSSDAHSKTAEVEAPPGIFGVPLKDSIQYANVAISLMDDQGKSFIYGYVPIVVAKCGVFLKEKGEQARALPSTS